MSHSRGKLLDGWAAQPCRSCPRTGEGQEGCGHTASDGKYWTLSLHGGAMLRAYLSLNIELGTYTGNRCRFYLSPLILATKRTS